ncbi:MAG: PKD domain-containing protein [Desulfobulbaceae bacterium]|nr:PKD domain-containing protein [Desulfobulbaceae bacterium]
MNNTGSGLGHDIYIDNDEDEDFIYSPVVMLNNNFDQSPVGFSISEPAYALKLDPSNLNDQAPLFVSAGTDDFHLNTGSPCIDTGSNDASELPVYDREGGARIMDGVVYMGAYEHPGSILPVALFSVDLVEGVIPLTVNYIDESIGSISTWTWSFGDGAFSSEQHPNHTYNEAGSYTVSLTVTGPNGSTLETKTDLIVVELTRPVAVAGPDRAIVQNDITLDGNSSSDVDGLVDTDTMVLLVSEPWDVNNDQTLGLEEVIHILRVKTGE